MKISSKILLLLVLQIILLVRHLTAQPDSLLVEFKKIPKTADNISKLIDLSYNLIDFNVDSALSCAYQIRQISLPDTDYDMHCKILINLGNIAKLSGKYDESNKYLFQALEIAEKNNLISCKIITLYQIGDLNRCIGLLDQSLYYLYLSKNFAHQNKVSQLYPELYDHISSTFYQLTEDTFPDFKLTKIPFQNEFNLKKSTPDVYLRLCKIYADSGLMISNFKNDNRTKLSCLNVLGAYYRLQHSGIQAIDYFSKAIELAEQINYKIDIPNYYINIARTYFDEKQYEKAIEIGLKAYRIAVELNILAYKSTASNILRISYIEKKDYKNALQYQHIEASTRAEILSQENWSKITELDKKYQTEQKEKEIELQKTLLDLKNAEVNKRNIIIACLLITCIIIIIGIIYIQRNNAKLKEANKKIANQNEEIHAQSEKLKATNSKLVELDHFKEGMTGMIVHDLKNPLSSILGNELSYETKKAAQQMLTMVMNILDVQKLESTEMKLSFANVHLFTLATDATQEVAYLSERKSIQILNIIPKELYINADYEIIKRVFINLLTNALKYSPNNESITLYTDNNQKGFENHVGLFTDFVKICISDRGIGIPQTQLIKVFDKFAQIEARSIGKLRSTGLGLTFCKLAVEAHKGKIGVESEIEHGSTFWFLLPKGLNSETVTTDNNQENETISGAINLNESDIKYLMPFCTELQQYEVFEFSKIIEIIDRINIEENSNVENWKRILENAVRACNENKYNHLILNKLKNA